jgi:hypothetical protein
MLAKSMYTVRRLMPVPNCTFTRSFRKILLV